MSICINRYNRRTFEILAILIINSLCHLVRFGWTIHDLGRSNNLFIFLIMICRFNDRNGHSIYWGLCFQIVTIINLFVITKSKIKRICWCVNQSITCHAGSSPLGSCVTRPTNLDSRIVFYTLQAPFWSSFKTTLPHCNLRPQKIKALVHNRWNNRFGRDINIKPFPRSPFTWKNRFRFILAIVIAMGFPLCAANNV